MVNMLNRLSTTAVLPWKETMPYSCLYFLFMLGKYLKLVRICFTCNPENFKKKTKKNYPKSHHFPMYCSWSGCGVTSVASSSVRRLAIGCLSQQRRFMAPAKSPGRAVTVQNNNRADSVFSLRLRGLQQILHFETRPWLSTKDFKTLSQLAYYILVYFSSVSKAHTNTYIITPRPQIEIHCSPISAGHLLMLLRSSYVLLYKNDWCGGGGGWT